MPLLNSSLIEFFFRTISALIRGDYLRFFTQSVVQIPIRRIHFTTPVDERNRLAHEALALYTNNKREELLTFVEVCLAQQTEQSDVVHDVLVYLAEQMIEFNQQRYKAVTDFIFDLQAELSDTQFQKINRLWTPPSTAKIEDGTAEKQQSEAEKMLGPLVERQLDLRNDIGKLYEEQWIWLLRNKLNGGYSLANLVRAYRTYQPLIAGLDKHILATDRLIDEIVYRVYGLTQEERAGVEELRNG